MLTSIQNIYNAIHNPQKILVYGRYWALQQIRKICCILHYKKKYETFEKNHFMRVAGNLFLDYERVIQVIGVPRSGTTLLCSILNNHSKVLCISEPFLAFMTARSFEWSDKDSVFRVSLKAPIRFINHYLKYNTGVIAFKETFRSEDDDYYPSESFIHENIRSGIKTIAVFRDPRAVWYSTVTRFDEAETEMPSLLFFRTWNTFIEKYWNHAGNVLCIRYEDLVRDPATSAELVFRFLHVEYEGIGVSLPATVGKGDTRAHRGGHVDSTSLNKWSALSTSAKREILHNCGKGMQEVGYVQ